MKILLVHPSLTLGDDESARRFFEACRDEFERRAETVVARNPTVLAQASLGREDAVVFFNQAPGKSYAPQLLSVLEKAVSAGAEVVPIAMTKDLRAPPQVVTRAQSWDIVEQLRQRALPPENLKTVALALSRTLISRLKPTLARDRMHFFISHRRKDGEELAGALYDKLHQRNESAFRDLNDVAVGEDAQRKIADHLSRADAVIFLDTPLAATSEWVLQELRGALARNIPIVWIRLGPDVVKDEQGEKKRPELPVKPGPAAHLLFPEASAFEATPDRVDQILELAFRLTWESALRVYEQIDRLQALQKEHPFELKPLDQRALIYAAHFPRTVQRYPERRVSHLLQFYGRRPTGDDVAHLREDMQRLGFAPPHEMHGPFYDAALLLSPFPSLPSAEIQAGECVVDSMHEYVKSMSARFQHPEGKRVNEKGLIISGAFPKDISPQRAQWMTDAVHAFVRATLEQGGTVIFGAHPTFQPLIFELARQLRPRDFKEVLHLYVSRLFVTSEAELEAFRQHATVFPVDAVGTDRNLSLTRMREAMIADGRAVGLVALGGLLPRAGIKTGIDEEVDLASGRQLSQGASEPGRKLAVFFVGAPGGRAAELAAREETVGWMGAWNSLTTEQNELLRTSPDFDTLADLALRSVGIKA